LAHALPKVRVLGFLRAVSVMAVWRKLKQQTDFLGGRNGCRGRHRHDNGTPIFENDKNIGTRNPGNVNGNDRHCNALRRH
jgi:hypothetical protein